MDIIVQKFGGSSLSDTDKLFNVCNRIIDEYKNNKGVVVVVSAQGKTTDKLVAEELEISNDVSKREHDVLVSVGEQISISKLVMCLNELGYKAISYTGWQIPIITSNIHGNADIIDIKTDKIISKLNEGYIVVVAGFQGVNEKGDITTLGRGGSDTTAVALSAYLNASKCYIFTDVDGVYDKDPNSNNNAIKYQSVSYDDMLLMAQNGAKVLHYKCVLLAKKYNVLIEVKSTFNDNVGTLVSK